MRDLRTFLGWDGAALPRAAAHLADRYTADGEIALRACIVALPGARAGRRLKELLVEEAAGRGLRLAPPRVTTVGALPELLYEPRLPLAGEALGRRLWARALRALPPEQAERLFAAAAEPDDVRGWTTLARQMESLHREVSGGGLTFAQVAERCGGPLLFDDAPRWTLLAEVQAAYLKALARLRLADRHRARLDALAGGHLDATADVWLVGVAELPRVTRAALAALPDERVHALVHAPVSLEHAFDASGCVLPSHWADADVPLTDDRLVVVEQPADQADAVVRELAALGGARSAEEISVAVPDAEVVPYLDERLGEHGVPARHAEGTPVRASAPWRLLAAVADVQEGGSAEAWAALARHPDLWRWLRGRDRNAKHPGAGALAAVDGWLAPLDGYLERHLPARLGRGLPGGESSTDRLAVDALLQAVGGLLAPLEGRRPLGGWMPEIMALLLQVYGAERLSRHVPEERGLLAVATHLRNAAAELARVPQELDEPCTAAAAIRVLLDDVGDQAVPPEPDHAAVEMLGWLEMHLDDAPVAVLTGLNEGFLPESINADPFLPDALRTALGLEDNAQRYARDAYRLCAVLESRERVRLVVGRRSAAGDPLRPSRLVLATSGPPLAERILRFFGETPEHEAPPGSGTAPSAVAGTEPSAEAGTEPGAEAETESPEGGPVPPPRAEPESAFLLPPEPELRASAAPERVAVTTFRALLQDPYLYALERVLRLREQDDAPRELDPLLFGGLGHEVLERFGRDTRLHGTKPEEVAAALDRLLDRVAAERFGAPARPAVRLQLEQLRRRLHAFADWQAERTRAGWRIHAVECSTSRDGVPFVVDDAPIGLTGRIDRIDHHPEHGSWAVFDYKTGDRGTEPEATHRKGRGAAKRWVDLQLPLYRHILAGVTDATGSAVFEGDPPPAALGYISLCADAEQVGAAMAEWTDAELEEADEAARDCVRMLRRNVFSWSDDAGRYARGDMAALLGAGRLVSPDDEDEDEDEGNGGNGQNRRDGSGSRNGEGSGKKGHGNGGTGARKESGRGSPPGAAPTGAPA